MQSEQLIASCARTPSGIEQSYRLLIDELPQPGEAPTNGVSIRLRYSIPCSSARPTARRSSTGRCAATAAGCCGCATARAARSSRRSARDRRRPRVPAHARIARLRSRAARASGACRCRPASRSAARSRCGRPSIRSRPARSSRWSRRARPPVRRPASPLRHAPAGSPPTDAKRARRARAALRPWPAACS